MSVLPGSPQIGAGPATARRRPSRGRRSSMRTWRTSDRLVYGLAWASGLLLCLVAGALVIYMLVRGVQYLRPSLLFTHPDAGLVQSQTGGFLDPIIGTLLLAVIGIVIATPLAVVTAVWLMEYGRPRWLARVVESSVEIIAGTPDIVIAIFGLALSFTSSAGGVFGRSFLAAGAMISLVALPSVFIATRNGLLAIPASQREAGYALGKTRITVIRRVLLPRLRPDIATGATLGIGRIIGDTAIVVVLLGATLRIDTQGGVPGLNLLRGTGSTLTSYIYENSPAGDANAPQKAYAAAFILLLLILALNSAVGLLSRLGSGRRSTRMVSGL
jgi:phosphate transport system permease protein